MRYNLRQQCDAIQYQRLLKSESILFYYDHQAHKQNRIERERVRVRDQHLCVRSTPELTCKHHEI